MAKAADAFRTISEVAEWLDVPAHVLRFWESKFTQVKPVKRAGGRRYYRPADMRLLGGIKTMLHDQGMTIKAVQKYLRDHGVQEVSCLSQPLDDIADAGATAPKAGPNLRDISTPATPEPAVVDFRRKPPARAVEDAEEAVADQEDIGTVAAEHAYDPTPIGTAPPADTPPPGTGPDDIAPSSTPEETAPEPTTTLPDKSTAPAAPDTGQDTPSDDPEAEAPAPTMPDTDPPLAGPPAPDQTATAEPDPDEDEHEDDIDLAETAPALPDLPDDPADDSDAAPGILSALSRLPRPISPELASRLATLRGDLQDRVGRATDRP